MGRAIVRDPQVFLFDEPLSNLDAKLRVQMRTEIKELHQRLKTTSIYVTHDQIEAMTMADKIVVMRDGIVEQTGGPLELYDRPVNTFVAGIHRLPGDEHDPGHHAQRRVRDERGFRRRRRAAHAGGARAHRRPSGALRAAAPSTARSGKAAFRCRSSSSSPRAPTPSSIAASTGRDHGDDRRPRQLPSGRPDPSRA
jgi:ABC-type proline/glycine betaine transport system ATPase subunit